MTKAMEEWALIPLAISQLSEELRGEADVCNRTESPLYFPLTIRSSCDIVQFSCFSSVHQGCSIVIKLCGNFVFVCLEAKHL